MSTRVHTHRPTLARRLRRPALLCAALLAGPMAAGSVAQEVTFTFEGRGFGHGVGMSQYGARGAALQGWDAARILGWYYRGTRIADGPASRVRVLVAADRAELVVAADGGGTLIDVRDGERIPLVSGVRYTARVTAQGLAVIGPDGTTVDVAVQNLRIAPDPGALVRVGDRRFRGLLDLTGDAGLVDAVNTLDMEDYLRGVLAREMPASWGDTTPAALQVQAIAARSYAIASLRPTRPFDLYADVRSQVYGGVRDEDPRTDAAVAGTRRKVLMYGDRIISAYYSSTSGGHTENVENSLGGPPQPYLVGVPDPFDNISPVHRWPDPPSFTAGQLGSRLRLPAAVTEVEVLRRGASPRVQTVRFRTADGGATELSGNSVRARLGLLDTWFWVRRSDRPAPAEPNFTRGGNAPPPVTPAPKPPTRPVARPGIRVGDFLVVASRQPSARDASTVLRLVRAARPAARVVPRPGAGTRAFLVVTLRTGSRAAANRELARLRALGYAATLARAVAGDPAVPLRTAPVRVTPATAVRFRVIAADLPAAARARTVATRLRATGRRVQVVRVRTASRGTRFLVVTLTRAPDARARAERAALTRLGYRPRMEPVRT